MITIKNKPQGLVLSSSLSSLIVESDKNVLTVSVLNETGDTIFSEEYYAYGGKVEVFDLNSIIEADLKLNGNCVAAYSIAVEWFNRPVISGSPSDPSNYQSDSSFFKVLFCEAMLPKLSDISVWLENNFLTTSDARRIPSVFDFRICFFSDKKGIDPFEVKCLYRSENSDVVNMFVYQGNPSSSSDNLLHIDLSDNLIRQWMKSENIPDDNLQIVSFSIDCGGRYVSFFLDKSLDDKPTFFFRNIFNVWDFITIPALTSEKTEVERSLADIGHKSMFYDKTVSKSYEVQTGPVTVNEVDLIAQLVASHDVYRIVNNIMQPILITDPDCSSKDNSELQSVKFTWRYADNRVPLHISVPDRIFTKEYNKVFS